MAIAPLERSGYRSLVADGNFREHQLPRRICPEQASSFFLFFSLNYLIGPWVDRCLHKIGPSARRPLDGHAA